MLFALPYIAILYATLLGSQSVLVVSSIVQEPIQALRPDYIYTPGVGAHKIHLQSVTWNTARRTCDQEGGHLAIINSDAEAQVIRRLLNDSNSKSSYLGVHDLYAEEEFVTIHGEPLSRTGFNAWRAGQPDNNGGNENCVMIYIDGLLNDVRCNSRIRFVCELPNIHSCPSEDSQWPGITSGSLLHRTEDVNNNTLNPMP